MIWICIIAALLSTSGLIYSIANTDGEAAIGSVCSLMLFASVAGIIDITAPEESEEYPASEYTLEYKVTTIGEQSDTTYVLTKIKEN